MLLPAVMIPSTNLIWSHLIKDSLNIPENPPTLPENTFQHNYQLSMSFLSRETHCPQDCEHVFHLNFDTIRII